MGNAHALTLVCVVVSVSDPQDGRLQTLASFKFTSGYMVIATALMRFTITGLYGVQLTSNSTDLSRWQIKFGEMVMGGTGAFLQVTQPGAQAVA